MTASGAAEVRGFVVHAYADPRRNRLYLTGRLEDGRSFAVAETRWRPSLLVRRADADRLGALLSGIAYTVDDAAPESFDGKEPLLCLRFNEYLDRARSARLWLDAGIPSPDAESRPADSFLTERRIRGPVAVRGQSRPGRWIDLVFPDPELGPAEPVFRVGLHLVSLDIETDEKSRAIRAISVASQDAGGDRATGDRARDSYPGFIGIVGSRTIPADEPTPGEPDCRFFSTEKALLEYFAPLFRKLDPDVVTGWNILDFDFPRLAERFAVCGLPFLIGRSREAARYLPGQGRGSATVLVPGRQVVDALRAVRSGPQRYPDYALETVAQAVLGEGKAVSARGVEKLAQLDRLYHEDPAAFGRYCYRDAVLVLRILEKTGLFRLTVERAALTGVSLDKAWTSVVSFERVYALELQSRGIAPPPQTPGRRVSGAAGGAVLDAVAGLFENVAVFDFRSLYPTIIRTFNVDPLSYARCGGTSASSVPIVAPNGAAFSRETGILPGLIDGYFAARSAALEAGDQVAAYVYKILQNSYYGVLGTGSCRYGRTELAGAITSFARRWLHKTRDWFAARGYAVLYGDTDSLFVRSGLTDGASYADYRAAMDALGTELNAFLAQKIRRDYDLRSFLELRFEKAYRRFMIPPLRSGPAAGRGRAKGYAGSLLLPSGGTEVEVKGMEAVRSDATPLARRLQRELLELLFSGAGEAAFRRHVAAQVQSLRSGGQDGELVYRKRLTRPPESYTANTPPQVKAARALGWSGRRGTIEYVWTSAGAEPVADRRSPLDYDHYLDSQLLPVAVSIAAAAGWNTEFFPPRGARRRDREDGQIDLFSDPDSGAVGAT